MEITADALRQIIEHARRDTPLEACGYLGESAGVITQVFPLKNMDSSGEHFSFDPREQFEVVRLMRGQGVKPAAVYHSHPATPARPSQEDIRLAYDPDLFYVIASLSGKETVVKAFRIQKGVVSPEELLVCNQR